MGISAAHAQALSPSAGSILQQAAPPQVTLTAPGQLLTLPEPSQQASNSTVQIPVGHLVIAGNHLIPDDVLHALVQPAENQQMTLGALRDYVDRITEAYHKKGYPVAYAYLPAQKIQDGLIKVTVVEPTYDEILIKGTSRLNTDVVRTTVGVHSGDVVEAESLQRGLLLLNQTPGVQIKGTLIPGAHPDTSSLQIENEDQPLFIGTISDNSYGNKYTGTYLTNLTLSANDPFGFGGSLSVNGLMSNTLGMKSDGFTLTSLNVWDGLRAGGYGSQSFYKLGGTFSSLGQVGRSTQLGGDLNFPLILQPSRVLNLRFDVLRDWLAQKTESTGTNTAQKLLIERLSLQGALFDSLNGTTTANLTISNGHNSPSEDSTSTSVAGTAGSFQILQLGIGRTQELPYNLQVTANLTGQLSSKNLDSSQQFFIGGPYGVMSYATGDGGGDEGYLVRAELSHALRISDLPGQLIGSLHLQNGTIWVHHSFYEGATGPKQITLNGIGPGTSYKWEYLNLSGSYLRRIGSNGASGYSTNKNQLWFQIGLST